MVKGPLIFNPHRPRHHSPFGSLISVGSLVPRPFCHQSRADSNSIYAPLHLCDFHPSLIIPNIAARPKITKTIPPPKKKISNPFFHTLLLGYIAYQELMAIEAILEWKNMKTSPNKTKNISKSNSISFPITYVTVSDLMPYRSLQKKKVQIHNIRSMNHQLMWADFPPFLFPKTNYPFHSLSQRHNHPDRQ